MAVLNCEKCGLDKKLPNKFANRKVRCPKCGEPTVVHPDAEDLNLEDVIDESPANHAPTPRATQNAITEDELTEAIETGDKPGFIEGGLFKNISGGLASGLLNVLFAVAVATLVFSQGPLPGSFPHAVSMALMSATIMGLFVALRSRIAFVSAGPETMAGVVLFLLVGYVHSHMAQAPAEVVYATVLGAIAVSALFTGLFLLATGLAKSSDFIRYIPIQAVGGVLAAVGWMILTKAVELSLGQSVCLADFVGQYFTADLCLRWGPAVALGFLLFLFLRWRRNTYTALLLIVVAAGACYGFLYWQGIGLQEARAQGWLLKPFVQDVFWQQVYTPEFLKRIDWLVIVDCAGYIAALAGLIVASVMIRVTEMEVFIGRPIDLDAEFRILGVGNMLSSVLGGMPGTMSLDRSLANRSAGARGVLAGLVATVVCALALFFANDFIGFIPRFIPAGMLIALGFLLMWRWLVEARSRFSHKGDYGLLFLVFLITASLGLLTGMGIGAALAMIITAVRYGSVSVVKLEMSGAHFHSHVDRAPSQLSVLKTKGDQIYALTLQGFIFLGTTNRLVEMIVNRISDAEREPLRFVLLDFTFTSGLDVSIAISFIKLKQIALMRGITLVFTNVPFELEEQLAKAGCILNDEESGSITVTSLDYALEWAEDHILDDAGELHQAQKTLPQLLEPVFPDPRYIPVLMKVLKRVTVKKRKPVFLQGDQSDAMYFIEQGMVDVELELEGGKRLRLKKMGPGTVFGEMGLYTSAPRTASVIAAEDCVLYRLQTKTMSLLQTKRPVLASAIHRFIVALLADRVASANATIRDILR